MNAAVAYSYVLFGVLFLAACALVWIDSHRPKGGPR